MPSGGRLIPDPRTRWLPGRDTLVGGSPVRLLRLTPTGAALARRLLAGEPVTDEASGRLARRLLAGGFAHPRLERPGPGVSVAVVVPVRSDPDGLAGVLPALLATSVPGRRPAEILVVDDGSDPPVTLPDLARGIEAGGAAPAPGAEAPSPHLRLLRRGCPGGPGRARNLGAAATRAEVLIFIDADVRLPGAFPEWCEPLLAHFVDPALGAVAPRVLATPPAHWTEARPRGTQPRGRPRLARALAAYETVRPPLDRGPRPGPVGPGRAVPFVPSTLLAVRRSALVEVGGFNPELPVGEDVDLVWRLIDAGWEVRYDPSVTVGHRSRDRLVPWLAQRSRYGGSAGALARRHPGRLAPLSAGPAQGAAWAAWALGRPGLALAASLWVMKRVADQLPPGPRRWRTAMGLAGANQLGATCRLARALRGPWALGALGLGAALPSSRPALGAAILGTCAADAWRSARAGQSPPLWLASAGLGLADDLAYGAGVVLGALRHRRLEPLLPAPARPAGTSNRARRAV